MILEDRNEVFIKSANRLIKSILKESFSNNFLRINVDQSGFTSVVLIDVAIANEFPLKSFVPNENEASISCKSQRHLPSNP